MSHIFERYNRVFELADQDNCNGDCDLKPPHKRCAECSSRSAINECGEILGDVLREIDTPKPQEINPALSDLEKEYEHLSSITKFLI